VAASASESGNIPLARHGESQLTPDRLPLPEAQTPWPRPPRGIASRYEISPPNVDAAGRAAPALLADGSGKVNAAGDSYATRNRSL
jgi:hypothetical protein